MKALVVDDDLVTRMLLQEILAPYAEVHSCADGSEAVWASTRALERGGPYDLICMDLMMPAMGGLEALKLIRQEEARHGRSRPQATKVIIATASDDVDTIDKAFRELCDAYIVKPVDGSELLNLVQCLFPIEERVL
ncbi:Response regulator receiver domain protein (CheY-like) [Candidatus Sulfopaludibacter sp. SbA4]|nr:Response regulator receiver domain protein (CheY-like) [Candidatus Sulfopaludibacter sp. SbA4]